MLHQTMPNVQVVPEHYPPSMMAQGLSTLVSVAQWAVILGAFGGATATDYVAGTPLASLVATIQENKMPYVGGAWFFAHLRDISTARSKE